MDVGSATSASSSTASPRSASSAAFAQNFDSFLLLLTTQLKNQDPLSPMNSTEFTTQLVQFAGVEQNIKQTQSLEQLVKLQTAWQTTNAVGYIGRTIEASGKQVVLGADGAGFGYTLDRPAAGVTIVVRNAGGEAVRTLIGETTQGTHTLKWDGKNDAGVRMADGVYTFEVAARDALGKPIAAATSLTGKVTAVEMNGGNVILKIGKIGIPLSDVAAVSDGSV